MKAQLEAARVVVRALDAQPRCGELCVVLATWDGQPSALWRTGPSRCERHATSPKAVEHLHPETLLHAHYVEEAAGRQ